jgi:hypothetical protein
MIQQLTLKYGIIAGLLVVFVMLGFYLFDKALIFNTFVYYGSLIVPLLAMWMLGTQLQLSQNIDFPALLRQVFLVFILSEIIYYIWYYVMVNYIDTGLLEFQKQQMLASYQAMRANATDIKEIQSWNEMIQLLEKNGLPSVSLTSVLLQMGRGIIGGFILSYVVAFLLNRRK